MEHHVHPGLSSLPTASHRSRSDDFLGAPAGTCDDTVQETVGGCCRPPARGAADQQPGFNERSFNPQGESHLRDQGAQNGARTIVSCVLYEDDCPSMRHAFVQVKGVSGGPVPPQKDLFAHVNGYAVVLGS
jgi:hypothetical protein